MASVASLSALSQSVFSASKLFASAVPTRVEHSETDRPASAPTDSNFRLRSASFKSIQAHQEANSGITIVTKEGDKVTISASSAQDLSYSTYDAKGKVDGKKVSASASKLSLSSSNSLNISVEGDLNAQELQDIEQAIKGAGNALGDLLAGDVEAATKDTQELGKLQTIAHLDASFSVESQVAQQEGSVRAPRPPHDQHGHHGRRVDNDRAQTADGQTPRGANSSNPLPPNPLVFLSSQQSSSFSAALQISLENGATL